MLHVHLFRSGSKKASVHVERTIEDFLSEYDKMETFMRKEGITSDYVEAIAYPVIDGEPDFDNGKYIALNAITGRK